MSNESEGKAAGGAKVAVGEADERGPSITEDQLNVGERPYSNITEGNESSESDINSDAPSDSGAPAFDAAAFDEPKARHWSERIPIWRSIKAIQRQLDSLEARHQAQLHWHQHQINGYRERANQHQSQLMRHQIKLLVQQDALSRQQEQSERLQDALSRQQEQSERQQDELSRQQEQSERQQDELSRQQEQSERQQDELSRQQEQSERQQDALSRQQEQSERQQDELSRQQEQSERQQDELSRQQEQSERQQDALSRQQEQSERQQDELSRQQEQSERLQDELSGQQEQSLSQQESLNQNQETLDHFRDELNQHLLDITHGQDQTLQLQNQIQAQHESNQELDVRFSALARSVGFEHAQNPEFDRWYQNLQDLHRGSGEALAKTQSSYLPYFESLSPLLQPAGPILDLGCGRGEWLSLLAMQGWQVRGVDSSELVVEVARENGLDVQLGDLLTVLEAQPANSLAAVTAFQVIEHLPFECIVALVHSAFRALLPGGILLLETPNPENIQVAAYSFWMDPTHKKPIPPPLVMDLSYHAGFRDGLVLRQNPWPNWDQTPAEPSFEGQMNQRLFGPQDYAVLAYKPVTPS